MPFAVLTALSGLICVLMGVGGLAAPILRAPYRSLHPLNETPRAVWQIKVHNLDAVNER